MVSASIPSPDGVVENDRHHHHDHHTVEMDAAVTKAPTPDTDPVGVIEAALVRLVDDVGVLAEEDVVRAFSILKATDIPSYLRLRNAAKKTNRDCSVTVLDKLVRDELPGSDDDTWATLREDGSWLLDGQMPVSELKARLDIRDLPGEDRGRYNTVAGLLLSVSGHLPAVGERIPCAGWVFEVVDLDGRRIDKVWAQPDNPQPASET